MVPASRLSIPLPGTKVRLGVGLAAIVALLTGWTAGAVMLGRADGATMTAFAAGAGIVASVLVHEGAHALTARALGYRVEWILLGLLAGTTSYSGRDDRPLDRAAIALAGPAVSAAAVLVLLAMWAAGGETDLTEALFGLLTFNVLTVVVNLVPVPGSDGWQVATWLVGSWTRSRRPGAAETPETRTD